MRRITDSSGISINAPAKWLLVGLVGLALLGGGVTVALARGIRNNNPGNIRHGKDKWKGMSPQQTDAEFVQFIDLPHGVRAMAVILNTYRTRHRLNTMAEIVNRWAPPIENDTEAYIATVENLSGIAPTQVVRDQDVPALIKAMIRMENGPNTITLVTIEKGVSLA